MLSHLFHQLHPSEWNSVAPACFIPLFRLSLSYSITPPLVKEGLGAQCGVPPRLSGAGSRVFTAVQAGRQAAALSWCAVSYLASL